MERPKKQINIVWCDDNIDNLVNETKRELFALYECNIFKTAKTSNELKEILSAYKNQIDAVIVDFNMSDSKLIPEEHEARGFRWIHENIHHYPFPFYLFSGRDLSFIEEKYRQYEFPIDNDYFLSKNPYVSSERNRHFQADETNEMLEMIVEEVEVRRSPAFRVRQEYSEAFAAIDKFSLDGDDFINILNFDSQRDAPSVLISSANNIRCKIEKLMSQFAREGIIPIKTTLNDFPNLFSGKDLFDKKQGCKNSDRYAHNDLMPESLFIAFQTLLVNYTQDGSHDKDYLRIHFREYLEQTRDIYLVKALAIICLDIIRWASSFYDKYESIKPFAFQPFEAQIEEMSDNSHEIEGGIVHYNNQTIFVKQRKTEAYHFKKGTRVVIEMIEPYTIKPKKYDLYCKKFRNLDAST